MPGDHSPRSTTDGPPWTLYLAHRDPRRLVVFVHGFRGKATKTWQEFENSGVNGDWWRESDLLFVAYNSTGESIESVAIWLRERLHDFYPQPPATLIEANGERVRDNRGTYQELYLVGHSLGGVVIRRVLADAAQLWSERISLGETGSPPPPLNAVVRLFSPASAGFQAAGRLGMLHASLGWAGVEIFLRRSSAYSDLQPESVFLTSTRHRTEEFVKQDESAFASLRAHIVWAGREDVVVSDRYETDHVPAAARGKNHRSVCKPSARYTLPWHFVENGANDMTGA